MVSIVIPVYNRGSVLSFTLNSILEQNFKNWECILIDDGSTDDTPKLIESMSLKDNRFKFFQRPTSLPKGSNSCRNYGFQLAQGKYIKWIDSDDLIHPEMLEKQVEAMESDNSIKLCLSYGIFFNHDSGVHEEKWSKSMDSEDYLRDHILNLIRWPIGAMLWRKTALPIVPFDIRIKNSQEWLMHSLAILKLEKEEIFNLQKVYYFARRGNLRINSNMNSIFYFNKAYARWILLYKLLTSKKRTSLLISRLFKDSGFYFLLFIKLSILETTGSKR